MQISYLCPNCNQIMQSPDNEHDKEAICAELKGLGKIGYVANSTYTVIGDSYSAGKERVVLDG